MSKEMRGQIDNFKNFLLKENKISVNKRKSGFDIVWKNINNEDVGVFDVLIFGSDAVIVGYRKDDKSISGYDYIKKSIDYLLNLGYNVVSNGNRSDDAINIWKKLENDYKIETKTSKFGDSDKHNIKKILAKK